MSLAWQDDTGNATRIAPAIAPWNEQLRTMSTILPAAESDQPVRQDLVARVRRAIQEGSYETPEKWAVTLRRLLEVLRQTNSPSPAPASAPVGAERVPDNTPRQSPPTPHHE